MLSYNKIIPYIITMIYGNNIKTLIVVNVVIENIKFTISSTVNIY